MLTSDDELLSLINSQIDGIVWVTKSPLSEFPKFFRQIDYLADNLITSSLENNKLENSSFFLTKQFGKDFFILHSSTTSKITDDFKDYLDLMYKGAKSKSLFIIDEEETIKNKLKEKYKKWKFFEIPH